MKRGFCPGLYDPMESGDGLLVRVKPPLGRIHLSQALALARAARRHGNGCIELTNRGNLQIRGLSPDGIAPFAAAMVGCGLALADPQAERRRRVIASPIGGEDAAAIEAEFLTDALFDSLPSKFVVLAGAGGPADVSICGDRLLIAGATFAAVPDGGVAAAVARVTHAFLRLRAGEDRMAALVRRLGADRVYAEAGLRGVSDPRVLAPMPIGVVGPGAFAAGLPFGQLDAEVFSKVAALSGRFGDGVICVTPWRSFLFRGVADVGGLREGLADAELISDAADGRRRVVACAGAPRCASASVETLRDANLLVELGIGVHVSGCAKGCANFAGSGVTLVGRAGRYDLILQGGVSGMPIATHLTAEQARKWILKALPLAGAGQSPALSS